MTTSPLKNPRNPLWKVILPVVALIAVAVGVVSLMQQKLDRDAPAHDGDGAEEIVEGNTLPEFELETLDGRRLKPEQLGAKVILVNFWATWCEACLVEMPSLQKLYTEFKPQGLEIAAVNLDEETGEFIPQALEKLGGRFPIFRDPGQKLSEILDIHAIPITIIIDRNRKVLMIHDGERDWAKDDIRQTMRKWLEG